MISFDSPEEDLEEKVAIMRPALTNEEKVSIQEIWPRSGAKWEDEVFNHL